MDTLEKAELTSFVRYVARFLKSGIPIYSSKLPDRADRKTKKRRRKKRRAQEVAKRYAFNTNAIKSEI